MATFPMRSPVQSKWQGFATAKTVSVRQVQRIQLWVAWLSQILHSKPARQRSTKTATPTAATLWKDTSAVIADHPYILGCPRSRTTYSLKPERWMTRQTSPPNFKCGVRQNKIGCRLKTACRQCRSLRACESLTLGRCSKNLARQKESALTDSTQRR